MHPDTKQELLAWLYVLGFLFGYPAFINSLPAGTFDKVDTYPNRSSHKIDAVYGEDIEGYTFTE